MLSAERLLEAVWDENADPFTKTVQVTIGRLRRKLGEPPVIQTIPGLGYRIETGAGRQSTPSSVSTTRRTSPRQKKLTAHAPPPSQRRV